MTPAKTASRITKKITTAAALPGVLCLSIRALKTRTRCCHSRMLAAEIAAPVSSIAPLRQLEPTATQPTPVLPARCVIHRARFSIAMQSVVGQVGNGMGFLVVIARRPNSAFRLLSGLVLTCRCPSLRPSPVGSHTPVPKHTQRRSPQSSSRTDAVGVEPTRRPASRSPPPRAEQTRSASASRPAPRL